MNMMTRSRAFAILVGATVFAAPATAGEVTGGKNPKPTAVRDHANSICAFSGQEDGIYLSGFDEITGAPIFLPTPTGNGFVQTPSHETSPDIDHEPGVAGDSCRGGSW